MAPHSSTLAWKIPWMGSLAGCSPWRHKESDTTERLTLYFGTKHNSLEKVKTCPIEVVLLGGKGPMKGIVMK